MATVNFINRTRSQTRAGTRFVLRYTQREEKTMFEGRKLVSGVNCSPQSVYEEFINTKLLHDKDSGRMYYHFVQSFSPDENISPETAHEIALKLAEHYKDFEVLVSTHVDREHIHSHFIINSVSFETGMKLHQSASAIQELRQESDTLCLEYGLSICQPKERTAPLPAGEYHSAVRGESWKLRLANTIDECMQYAHSREMFVELMESEGYAVKWTDTRKNITYTTPDGKKCRDDRLHEKKYAKEMMECELRIREKIFAGRTQGEEQAAESGALSYDSGSTGQFVLQPTSDLERHRGAAKSAESSPEQRRYAGEEDGQTADTEGLGADEQEYLSDPAGAVTGWEKERALLFSAGDPSAGVDLDSFVGADTVSPGSIGSDLVHLGKSLEQLGSTPPVQDATTQMLPRSSRKKKKALGQKEDEHEEQGFKMTL